MLRSLVTELPFFVCFFWGMFFTFHKREKGSSKKVLGTFMFMSASMHLSYVVFFNKDIAVYAYFDWLFLFSSILIIPTFYLYVVSNAKESIHKWSSFYHYLPAAIFLITYLIVFSLANKEQRVEYLDSFMYAKRSPQLDFDSPPHVLCILFILNRVIFSFQNFFYVFKSIGLIKRYTTRIKNTYSETKGRDLNWIKTISICILFLTIFGTVFNILGRQLFRENEYLLSIPSILYSTMLFIIGFVGHKQNFSLTDLEEEEQKLIEINQKTRVEQPSLIRQNLERLMNEKKLFLTTDLRISSLCKELNTNRTYLSQVLNEELNENFNSYINKHRVNHAISLLRNKELNHYSLEKFSELSGFGSTVSMIRAFKQTTGKAPSEFRN